MKNHCAILLLTLLGISSLSACGSSNQLSKFAGIVSVDGNPVESGTIHFQSHASSKSSGGAAVVDGSFQIISKDGFEPGEYDVVLQAYRKTGHILNDPQKGRVEATTSIPLKDSPKTLQLSGNNAQNLSIDFSSTAK